MTGNRSAASRPSNADLVGRIENLSYEIYPERFSGSREPQLFLCHLPASRL
jgi:hypothetical protein